MDELRELIALLRENGLAEFELEREGFRVRLRREGTFVPGLYPGDMVQRQLQRAGLHRQLAPRLLRTRERRRRPLLPKTRIYILFLHQ